MALDILQKQKEHHHYWSLVVEPNWVQAGLWKVEGENVNIVSVSPPSAWETDVELVEAADSALSAAVVDLAEGAKEPSETVFGVTSSWTTEGEISEEFLGKIKKVCAELDLKPKGFVVLPEAIAHLYKSEEGSPLNGIVVGILKEQIELSIFRLGKVEKSTRVVRSLSVAEDVIEGLARIADGAELPSRFILFDGRDAELEEVRQALLKVVWDDVEKIKFLHTPKIETISPDRKVRAVSLAGASEISNAKTILTETKKDIPKQSVEGIENIKATQKTPEEVGFVQNQDITHESQVVSAVREDPVVGGKSPKLKLPKLKLPSFGKIIGSAAQLKSKLPKFERKEKTISSALAKPNLMPAVGAFLSLLLVGGVASWWLLPKAVVTVYLRPESIEEEADVTIDSNKDSSDIASNVLAGQVLSVSTSGDKTTNSSGTKTVGDKAKGTVSIQNGTTEDIVVDAGDILVSSSGLEFAVNEETKVIAAVSPSSPGTATVEATAAGIGSEYNLAKDEVFSITGFSKSQVDAVASTDFSGGASRQVLAVSTQDLVSLEEDLTDELVKAAKEELESKRSREEMVLGDSIDVSVNNIDFGQKVGDEASTIELSLDLDVSALIVKNKDIIDLAKDRLNEKISEGFVLRDNQVKVSFKIEDEEDGVYEVKTKIEANLLPEISIENITKSILGKLPSSAQKVLTGLPGFARAEIDMKPKFPGKLGTLPHVPGNLTVEIEAEK